MAFLDDAYELPASSDYYTKFVKWDLQLRILWDSLVCWLDWKDWKPVRTMEQKKPIGEMDKFGKVIKPKQVWIFVVYNYATEKIEICELWQKWLQEALYKHFKDENRGDPKRYDIKVNKSGEGTDTKYTLIPIPHKELSNDIAILYKEKKIDLRELLRGGDPFNPTDNIDDDLPFGS